MGGTIAASTPQNIVWAPANGNQPYYTLNGGQTWSPVTLPGVTSWSGFDWVYYLDQRSVTADRVLANTFYLYDPGAGVFETTNGGVTWTNVHPGYIESNSSMAGYNSSIQSVPGEASNLFYTSGPQGTPSATPANSPFYRSTNGGATWTAVANVLDVFCFGFGAAAPGQPYPAIYIVGYVNNVYGIWQSTNNAQSWTNIGTYPTGELDQIATISGDPNNYGAVYVGFGGGGGYAYLPGSTSTSPNITGTSDSPATGDLNAGKTVALTLTFSEAVTVAGGTPTLTLNDGGIATYASGSGTNALVFNYTVAAGQNAASLAATALNLPTGVTIKDSSGNAASLSLAGLSQTGPQIDTTTPAVTGVTASPATGTEDVGNTITFTVKMSEAVTVAGGKPTLTLNDGGTATYASGSGTNTLTFTTTVVSTNSAVSTLAITGVNLPSGVTIKDGAGNAANMAGAVTSFSGLSVDPVATVAYYLANKATLDAAGAIAIADTAANVSANIDALNSDAKVTSIALTDSGTPTLALTVEQTLNDTHALGAIANASYAIAIADTGANISANFDALNADAHVTSIAPAGSGTQVLTLTVAQVVTDTRALSILDPFTITVTGTAASLQGLTPAQMTSLSTSGLTLLEATDEGVAFTTAQKQALGAAGIALEQPYSGGTVEVINYSASGAVSSVQYLGIVGAAYSSYTVFYGANGQQTSASFSNGMMATWTFNANGIL